MLHVCAQIVISSNTVLHVHGCQFHEAQASWCTNDRLFFFFKLNHRSSISPIPNDNCRMSKIFKSSPSFLFSAVGNSNYRADYVVMAAASLDMKEMWLHQH